MKAGQVVSLPSLLGRHRAMTVHLASSTRVSHQMEVSLSCVFRLTCWVPHRLPVQVTVFFPDPPAKPMVKTATVYEDTCEEKTRETSEPHTNNSMYLLTRLSVHVLSHVQA